MRGVPFLIERASCTYSPSARRKISLLRDVLLAQGDAAKLGAVYESIASGLAEKGLDVAAVEPVRCARLSRRSIPRHAAISSQHAVYGVVPSMIYI